MAGCPFVGALLVVLPADPQLPGHADLELACVMMKNPLTSLESCIELCTFVGSGRPYKMFKSDVDDPLVSFPPINGPMNADLE